MLVDFSLIIAGVSLVYANIFEGIHDYSNERCADKWTLVSTLINCNSFKLYKLYRQFYFYK